MITEDYCSYEVAKLLKEKGFDYQGFDYIDFEGEVIRQDRPTHQMAMKWLRKEHNIHISVYVFNRELPITNVPIFYTCDIATEKLSSQQGHLRGAWKSYEEACEAAIKYCLENLI